MHYLAIIGFVAFGLLAIGFAVGHEVFWWKRRAWRRHQGVVRGFRTDYSGEGGPTYPAEIEYEVDGETREFVSQYSTDRKPGVGSKVPIVVSPDGHEAAAVSDSHRFILTAASLVLGVVFLWVGLNVKPLDGPPRLLFLVGARSSPEFSDLDEGDGFDPASGENIAVFGHGDLRRAEWGVLTIDWGSGSKAEFRSGGVMSWAPEGAARLDVSGEALVPLVAYLVEARTDDQLNPTEVTLRSKWRIEPGPFKISEE